jgi:hypothetical protein
MKGANLPERFRGILSDLSLEDFLTARVFFDEAWRRTSERLLFESRGACIACEGR